MKSSDIKKNIPVFIGFFLFYLIAAIVLYTKFGFYSKEGIFLMEKAILAFYGDPPRLENIGLIYPPLPFMLMFPFAVFPVLWGPQVVTAFAAALISTFFIAELRTLEMGRMLMIAFVVIMLFHPLVLYNAVSGGSAVLFVLLMYVYLDLLLRYGYIGKTYHLVMAGLVVGLMAFIRYETFFFLLFLLPTIPIVVGGLRFRTSQGIFALFLMNIVPPVIAFISWGYLNWLFSGNWLDFLHSPYSYFKNVELFGMLQTETLIARHSIWGAIKTVLSKAVYIFPLYFVFLVLLRNTSLIWYFSTPLLAMILAAYMGLTLFELGPYMVLIPLTSLMMAFNRRLITGWGKIVIIVLLIASMPLSLQLLRDSNIEEEANFAAIIYGERPEPIFNAEKEIAGFIEAYFKNNKKLLIDDAMGYPIVAFTKYPTRFILPYQYHFRSAVVFPTNFAAGYIVADPRTLEGRLDAVGLYHTNAYFNGINGATLVKEAGPWRVYSFE